MWELTQEIAQWHQKTFQTTEKAQKIKLLEELKEYYDSGELEEIADILFVLSSLAHRYGSELFTELLSFTLDIIGHDKQFSDEIKKQLTAKFEKNKNRTWQKQPDGSYHHV